MTWRAFIIGLLAVVLIAYITPYNDFQHGNTYITGCHFPPGPFFILLVITLLLNLLIKWVQRLAGLARGAKTWALRRSELMLIWCMMLVSSTVPSSGLMRFWFSLQVAPAYYAKSPDLPNQADVLEELPDSLVPTKEWGAVLAKEFFERQPGEQTRIYLARWIPSMLAWGVFILLFYFAIFFLGGILRKQWVEVERLIFPLARVPLDLAEGSEENRLLPALFRDRVFLVGVCLTLVFAFIRLAPALFGGEQGWLPSIPVRTLLLDTPLAQTSFGAAYVYPIAVAIAFLVPADVVLSVWGFFVFTRFELQAAYWMGVPITGGTYGVFMQWQQAGAFIVFTIMMFWAARRHLAAVLKKAFWIDSTVDDSDEPISYRVGVFGLIIAVLGIVGWFCHYDMHVLTAFALLALILCIALIHARVVCQGGIFFTQQTWSPPTLLHSMTGGLAFTKMSAIVAQMQNAILIQDSREILSGHAMNALRISSVFERHRRWFLPAMFGALLVAIVVCTWSTLDMYYSVGGYNIPNTYGTINLPKSTFQIAGQMINNPAGSADPHFGPLGLGAAIMFFVTVMRARFYWWPVHSLGFLISSTWPAHNLWFSFLLAWVAKISIMKFGGGATLRKARSFFMGVIIGEVIAIAASTILGFAAGIKLGHILLPT